MASVSLGDEYRAGRDELALVGDHSVEPVFGQHHDREVGLHVRLLVGCERDLIPFDRTQNLWADSERGIREPAD